MTDEQVPQHYPRPTGQHDTSVLSWPAAGVRTPEEQGTYGEQPYSQPQPTHPVFGPEDASPHDQPPGSVPVAVWPPQANPEAAYWESRFRRQRTWTRFLGAAIVAGLLLFVGGGLFAWNVLVPRAASTLSQGLTNSPADPEGGLGGTAPDQATPNGSGEGGAAGPDQPDLSEVPLPEALRGPGSALGIDNMEELLDSAVSMGLMTQEQADAIRSAVGSGGSLEGLLDEGGLSGQG